MNVKISIQQRNRALDLLEGAEQNLRRATEEQLNLSNRTRDSINRAIDAVLLAQSRLDEQPSTAILSISGTVAMNFASNPN